MDMRRALACAAIALAPVILGACDDEPTAPTAVTIVSPATLTSLSGGVDSRKLYRIVVPSGSARLTVTTSGGTGNVDLFVERGSVPNLTVQSDCESVSLDTEESCIFDDPEADEYYILLVGPIPYDGVTLTATIT